MRRPVGHTLGRTTYRPGILEFLFNIYLVFNYIGSCPCSQKFDELGYYFKSLYDLLLLQCSLSQSPIPPLFPGIPKNGTLSVPVCVYSLANHKPTFPFYSMLSLTLCSPLSHMRIRYPPLRLIFETCKQKYNISKEICFEAKTLSFRMTMKRKLKLPHTD